MNCGRNTKKHLKKKNKMKNKNDLWINIGIIIACLGLLTIIGIVLYKCFLTSVSLFIFICGIILFVIGVGIIAINDKNGIL